MLLVLSCTKQDDTILNVNDKEIFLEDDIIDVHRENLPITYKTMYVDSPEGLRVRDTPNLDGNRIALLDDLQEVIILQEDEIDITIDGIIGKWTFIKSENIEGWVFGGYLTEEKLVRAANELPLKTFQIADRNLFKFPLPSRYNENGYFEFNTMVYANGIFVAAAYAYAVDYSYGCFVYSYDGVTWTIADKRWDYRFAAITYGNGMFLAMGANNQLAYSLNGTEWVSMEEHNYDGAWELVFGNGKFVSGTYNEGLTYSEDGKDWQFLPASAISENAGDVYCINYLNGNFYVALVDKEAFQEVKEIAYSSDLQTWNVIQSNFGSFTEYGGHRIVQSIAYGNGRLLVFSHSEPDMEPGGVYITYSDDGGKTWKFLSDDYNEWYWINEITFVNGYFIAIGHNQKAAYSKDGISWAHIDDKTDYDPNDNDTYLWGHYNTSAYGNGHYVIAGYKGMIRVSQWPE
jgi:hypothetical protein